MLYTLTNSINILTYLKCQAIHVEFIEINIIMQLKQNCGQQVVKNWLVRKGPFSPSKCWYDERDILNVLTHI
jgi:hypothetical protein